MRLSLILSFFLMSCSSHKQSMLERRFASVSQTEIKLVLEENEIFANGANRTFLKVSITDKSGEILKVDPEEIELISDVPIEKVNITKDGAGFKISIMPLVKSPSIRLMVKWKQDLSSIVELKTTLHPMKESLLPNPWGPNTSSFISGLYYGASDTFKKNQYESFTVNNEGPNRIVSAPESSRNFEFQFEEQANENISLFMSDIPNETVSHTMHSLFMFFPRTYLPFAEVITDTTVVILPTGEQIVFNKAGEIIEGVFKEGPVDIGPDRFKRKYADLKYRGKGIIIRANARGQMPQQGQFESTPIDNEYGLRFSNQALIINGTTQERCRVPKTDFWSSEDKSPIRFKYPSDAAFNKYLLQKCKFGIPELKIKVDQKKVSADEEIESIWSKCRKVDEIESCLDDELAFINNENKRSLTYFELMLMYQVEKDKEIQAIAPLLEEEVSNIKVTLQSELSWVDNFSNDQNFKQNCLKKSQSLVRNVLMFHDTQQLIKPSLIQQCSALKEELSKIISQEAAGLEKKLLENFSWVSLGTKERFLKDCQLQGQKQLSSINRYQSTPKVYEETITSACLKVEASALYQEWLNSQTAVIEERVFKQLLIDLEALHEKKAQECIVSFPMDGQLNRNRFKEQREACLLNAWDTLLNQSVIISKKDPLALRLNLSVETLNSKIGFEKRKIHLRVIKKYFM